MKKILGKVEREVSPTFNETVKLIITIILTTSLTFIIAAFTFGLHGDPPYYAIQTQEHTNKDFLVVNTLHYNNNSPLSNVTIKVLEHGAGRLLSGPYITNESGYTIIQIPHGYAKHFDIVGEYQNVRITITIDKRPLLVKSEDILGSLGIGILLTIFSCFLGIVIGWFLKDRKNKKVL